MKTRLQLIFIKLSTLLILLGCSGVLNAGTKDSLFCLQIKGRVLNAGEGYSNGCKVQLLNHQGVVDSLVVKSERGAFTFRLKRNTYYAIRIQKAGYVSRLISVNTEFPDEIHDLCEFSFNTRLISEEEATQLNADELDFPVAIVHFEKGSETFIHNKEYSAAHRQKLRARQPKSGRAVSIEGSLAGNP